MAVQTAEPQTPNTMAKMIPTEIKVGSITITCNEPTLDYIGLVRLYLYAS